MNRQENERIATLEANYNHISRSISDLRAEIQREAEPARVAMEDMRQQIVQLNNLLEQAKGWRAAVLFIIGSLAFAGGAVGSKIVAFLSRA